MRALDFRKRLIVLTQEKLDELSEEDYSFSDFWDEVKEHIDSRVDAEEEREAERAEHGDSEGGGEDDETDLGEPLD